MALTLATEPAPVLNRLAWRPLCITTSWSDGTSRSSCIERNRSIEKYEKPPGRLRAMRRRHCTTIVIFIPLWPSPQ